MEPKIQAENQACAEIRACSGSQFHPVVMDAFWSIRAEMERTRAVFRDPALLPIPAQARMARLVVDNDLHPQPMEAAMNPHPLRAMKTNSRARIVSVQAQGELGRRIRDMGLLPGVEFAVAGRAPLKDPVALRLRDFTLTLRNNEADHIMVEPLGDLK